MTNLSHEITIPSQFRELFNPKWRHVVYKGGRASTKSQSVAERLLIAAQQEPGIGILCLREVQYSIDDSVLALLASLIRSHKYTGFKILKNQIRHENGSTFYFKGLNKLSVDNIKSMPNLKYAWVEEAQSVSLKSIDTLTPTIRAEGSQIYWTLNPNTEDDPVNIRIIQPALEGMADDTYVRHINSDEVEGFLSKTIIAEREKSKKNDPDMYRHVWLGEPMTSTTGAIFAKQISIAREEGRIASVPYDESVPVHVSWDLGIGDSMALWFFQTVGQEIHFIDYYEMSGEALPHYFAELRTKDYNYGIMFIPHDSRARELQTGKTREEAFRDNGFHNISVLPPNTTKAGHPDSQGIELGRNKFRKCWFDATKCARGIQCLKSYHYDYDERNMILKRTPKHDWSSHCADSFMYALMGIEALPSAVDIDIYVPDFYK